MGLIPEPRGCGAAVMVVGVGTEPAFVTMPLSFRVLSHSFTFSTCLPILYLHFSIFVSLDDQKFTHPTCSCCVITVTNALSSVVLSRNGELLTDFFHAFFKIMNGYKVGCLENYNWWDECLIKTLLALVCFQPLFLIGLLVWNNITSQPNLCRFFF